MVNSFRIIGFSFHGFLEVADGLVVLKTVEVLESTLGQGIEGGGTCGVTSPGQVYPYANNQRH